MNDDANASLAESVAQKAVERLICEMTDCACLLIEGDKKLRKEYWDAVKVHGVGAVNVEIADAVRGKLGLRRKEANGKLCICSAPKSRLLESYSELVL